jgi:hypothetical protein
MTPAARYQTFFVVLEREGREETDFGRAQFGGWVKAPRSIDTPNSSELRWLCNQFSSRHAGSETSPKSDALAVRTMFLTARTQVLQDHHAILVNSQDCIIDSRVEFFDVSGATTTRDAGGGPVVPLENLQMSEQTGVFGHRTSCLHRRSRRRPMALSNFNEVERVSTEPGEF